VTDGSALYQLPMTYRGAPIAEGALDAAHGLIAVTEHSVLGTRWIYDGETDPVWVSELVRLVQTSGVSDPSSKHGVGPAEARGHLLKPGELIESPVTVELRRMVTAGDPADEPGRVGVVMGTWHPDGPGTTATTGCLAVLRIAN